MPCTRSILFLMEKLMKLVSTITWNGGPSAPAVPYDGVTSPVQQPLQKSRESRGRHGVLNSRGPHELRSKKHTSEDAAPRNMLLCAKNMEVGVCSMLRAASSSFFLVSTFCA